MRSQLCTGVLRYSAVGSKRRSNRIKRMLIAGLTITVGLLAVAGRADAAQPRIVTSYVNVSFPDPSLTLLCGTEVRFFNVGTLNSKLFVDRTGAVIQEIDTTQGFKAGWSSPASGLSIEFPQGATLITDYPSGIAVGSPATVTGHGISAKVPGLGTDAGTAVFAGHVALINPDGVPIVAFDQLLSINGHSSDPAAFEAALCAALSP